MVISVFVLILQAAESIIAIDQSLNELQQFNVGRAAAERSIHACMFEPCLIIH